MSNYNSIQQSLTEMNILKWNNKIVRHGESMQKTKSNKDILKMHRYGCLG